MSEAKRIRSFRPDKKLMATLYVHGPEGVRLNWEAAAEMAHFKKVPPMSDPELRELIVREGGAVPEAFAVLELPTIPASVVEKRIDEEVAKTEKPKVNLDELLKDVPDDPMDAAAWRALARTVMPVWKSIAMGYVDATPAQVRVLQDIITRGAGKAGQPLKPEEEVERGAVVILPTLGSGASMTVDLGGLRRAD